MPNQADAAVPARTPQHIPVRPDLHLITWEVTYRLRAPLPTAAPLSSAINANARLHAA